MNDVGLELHTRSRLCELNSDASYFQVFFASFPQGVKNSRRTRRHSASALHGCIADRRPAGPRNPTRTWTGRPKSAAQTTETKWAKSRVTLCRFGMRHNILNSERRTWLGTRCAAENHFRHHQHPEKQGQKAYTEQHSEVVMGSPHSAHRRFTSRLPATFEGFYFIEPDLTKISWLSSPQFLHVIESI